MMLQVISKKFFKSDNYHSTLEKTIIYSNVNLFYKLETNIATLEPIETFDGITSYLLTFENVLEYQKDPRFQLVAVGQGEIVEDLLACLSFYFNGIFETDRNYIENLLREEQKNISDKSIPKKLLPEIFKRNIYIGEDKTEEFSKFVNNLLGLPNKKYIKVIASIKQVKDAIITINYNLELSYTMFVAAIESLATEFDSYKTKWEDCLSQKNRRKDIDNILKNVDENSASDIRTIIIDDTHAKLGMRYRMFILKYISDKYYEEIVWDDIPKCKESLLEKAIKNSYQIRSSYVHALQSMPDLIKYGSDSEVYTDIKGNIFFTFNGITRLTKFVIKEFIYTEEKMEKEDIDYMNRLPGMIQARVASEYWIHNEKGYSIETAFKYYQGLLEYISKGEYKESGFIDLKNVCKKIEQLIKGLNNNDKKIALVDFYLLYNFLLREEYRCENLEKFEGNYGDIVEEPYIENAMIFIVLGLRFPWNLDILNNIYDKYDRDRFKQNKIRIPNKLEICYMLEVANMAFIQGKMDIVRKFIIKAYRERSNDKNIEKIYFNLKESKFEVINWHQEYISN
ncbi:hypothetical protein SAMN05444401_2732 [Clostridium amylolyticum]|uniref:Uncharacterized protein n=1 Tax=Clostridium amylolyticum TaxID=1121298 RepID=A0A1M6IBQ8_9CLOT|nr:hypothetical protein [Clostridium amylolyticum]SHJ31850.1 hypothetical protein SAMN05444401_2732 [Clostridium amylolyticum]